ncbi:hypothetical protein BV898_11038 [Hypsibius exemplaris]|uniref:Uncharacterized protein n=1 Tax=Hypsibius exemplaris TaxID=2072580 RepID=A0A1W0WHU4_HYPEX|nr:hypothetical protein BV898_11038 [Hypsibius exemplaris]
MTMIAFRHGKALLSDATVSYPLAISHSRFNAGSRPCCKDSEASKHRTYADLEKQCLFVLLASETFGTWGSEGKELIADIARRITDRTGAKRAADYLRQKISINNY